MTCWPPLSPARLAQLRQIMEPNLEEVSRAMFETYVVLLVDKVRLACPLLERLRGSDEGPVIRLTRKQVEAAVGPDDPAELRAFLESRTETARGCLVASGGAYFLFNFGRPPERPKLRLCR